VAAIADDIAYNTHDIDDGLRAGYLTFEMLEEVPFLSKPHDAGADEISRARQGALRQRDHAPADHRIWWRM
jgi:dGTP triphosphohydrolase